MTFASMLRRCGNFVSFLVLYISTLVRANMRIAMDILTPGVRFRPGFLAVQLETRSNLELLALSNLITMTPGTLTLDISLDHKILYLHALYCERPEAVRAQIAGPEKGLQSRVIGVLR